MELKKIGIIKTEFKEKFGVPRQSNMTPAKGKIILHAPFNSPNAVKGLEGYDYIWLLWGFSLNKDISFHATVRPPKLGGNDRMGVFATRSPYRPNPIGLSSVRLLEISEESGGVVLYVSGADLVDGTPIYDIKPYLAYADAHFEAASGFAGDFANQRIQVRLSDEIGDLEGRISQNSLNDLMDALSCDPRPAYHEDENRIYGMKYSDFNVKFTVKNGILTILSIEES